MQEQMQHDVGRWYEISAELKRLRAEERKMREQIATRYFGAPSGPTEGAESLELPDGSSLVLTRKLIRSIDEAALPAVAAAMPPGWGEKLVRWKPGLDLREYKKTPQPVRDVFAQALIVKQAAPTLEVKPPKK